MRSTPVLALVSLLLVPLSGATWSAHGGKEPDHAGDVALKLMWPDAPGASTSRIYFAVTGGPLGGDGNPNVALLSSRFISPAPQRFTATLGVWTDCNGDGYVGVAETAMREYPSQLLVDSGRCRASFGPTTNWNGANNYNGWITELIPIGNTPSSTDKRIITDPDARVWGDLGLPGAAVDDGPKTTPDIHFAFTTMQRGGLPAGGLTGSAGAPSDAGLMQGNTACAVCMQSEWLATSPLASTLTSTSRFTFYAQLGAASLTGRAIPGGLGTYGEEACGSLRAGASDGWACDPAAWGAPPGLGASAKIGDSYVLRDVDCYDGSFGTPTLVGEPIRVAAHPASLDDPCV